MSLPFHSNCVPPAPPANVLRFEDAGIGISDIVIFILFGCLCVWFSLVYWMSKRADDWMNRYAIPHAVERWRLYTRVALIDPWDLHECEPNTLRVAFDQMLVCQIAKETGVTMIVKDKIDEPWACVGEEECAEVDRFTDPAKAFGSSAWIFKVESGTNDPLAVDH